MAAVARGGLVVGRYQPAAPVGSGRDGTVRRGPGMLGLEVAVRPLTPAAAAGPGLRAGASGQDSPCRRRRLGWMRRCAGLPARGCQAALACGFLFVADKPVHRGRGRRERPLRSVLAPGGGQQPG